MKAPPISAPRRLAFVLAVSALISPATGASAAGKPPPDLLVKINLEVEWRENTAPPGLNAAYHLKQLDTWNQYDQRLRETFLQRLSQVLKAKGFKGRMALIETATQAEEGLPIIVIDLARWNATLRGKEAILGPFDCEFKARLVTPQTALFLAAVDYHDPFCENIERSTDAALAEFHGRLVEYVKLGLLPGPG